jgi:cytidine deaminase
LPDSDRRRSRDRRRADRRTGLERRKTPRGVVLDPRFEADWQPVVLETSSSGVEESAAEVLVAAAAEARAFAQAPYSRFKVGAALETADGTLIGGCNIENATYGLTICAERVALVKALSDGHTLFTRIAVVADTEAPTPPCGPCRQLLWEYCGDIEVVLGNLQRTVGRHRLSSLLPLPFDRRLLE